MNPFDFSPGLTAHRSYLSSLRCPRFPSGHSRAQCPCLRHLAHLARSFSCWNAQALQTRSLLPTACASSWTEEAACLLRGIKILSDSQVPRVSERWSSLQQYLRHFIFFHCRLLTVVGDGEDTPDWRLPRRVRSSFQRSHVVVVVVTATCPHHHLVVAAFGKYRVPWCRITLDHCWQWRPPCIFQLLKVAFPPRHVGHASILTSLWVSKRAFCGGEVLVIGPHLLGDSAQGSLLLNLREDEGQDEVLEDKDEEEEESEVDEQVKEVRENAQLMHATW